MCYTVKNKRAQTMNNDYIDLSDKLSPQEIVEFLGDKEDITKYTHWQGIRVKRISQRYDALRNQSFCMHCRKPVDHGILQKHPSTETNSGHFNFYDIDGKSFTKVLSGHQGWRLICSSCKNGGF